MKYEPFNLEKALAGEPVVTRDGREVSHVMVIKAAWVSRKYPVAAVIVDGKVYSYTEQGRYHTDGKPSRFDLFMKPKTRIINGFEVPAPEAKEPDLGDIYFTPDIYCSKFYRGFAWDRHVFEARFLERGLVFLRKEDAIATAKAMVGIDPYGD